MSDILKELRASGYTPSTNLSSSLKKSINRAASVGKVSGTKLFGSYVEIKEAEDKFIRDLLQKVLASSLASMNKVADIEKRSKISNQVNRAVNKYNDNKSVDIYELKSLTDTVRSLTDSTNSAFEAIDKLVKMDTQSLVRQQVNKSLVAAGGSPRDAFKLNTGRMTPQEYSDKNRLVSVLDKSLSKDSIITNVLNDNSPTDPRSRHDYQSLVNSYRNGSMNPQTFSQSARVLPGIDPVKMNKLEEILSKIEQNTDPNTNKMSNADEIRNQSRSNAELKAFKEISEFLKAAKTDNKSNTTASAMLNSSSDRDLGYNAVNQGLFGELVDDADLLDGEKRTRKGPKSKSPKVRTETPKAGARPRGKFGSVLRAGKSVAKAAAKGGSKSIGALSSIGKGAGRAIPGVGTAITVGMGAYDYANAEDNAERIDAVSTTSGALAGAGLGAAVGSVVPVVGTAIGAVVGGLLGAWGGSWLGDKVKDPIDLIPDSTKDKGPMAELNYIDNALYPTIYASIQSGDSQYSKDDLDKLLKYRKDLIDNKVPKWMVEHAKEVSQDDIDSFNNTRNNPELNNYPARMMSGPIPRGQEITADFEGAGAVVPYHGLGSISSKYETGGRGVGTISSGKGDPGGASYGSWQLSSKAGTLGAYLSSNEGKKYGEQLKGLTPGTPEFNRVYSQIVAQDGENFNNSQKAYLTRENYQPVLEYAKKAGMDVDNKAVQEAIWSQSMQHGREGNFKIIDEWKNRGGANQDFKESMTNLYQSRGDYASQFASSAATTNRYRKELASVINYNNEATPDVQAAVDQGMSKPTDIALATGRNVSDVRKMTQSNDKSPQEYVSKRDDTKSSPTPGPSPAPAIVNGGSNQGGADIHRLSDNSIKVAAMLRG